MGSLASVSLPSTLNKIGDHAFSNDAKLNSVTIPGNVTEIGSYAFGSCSSLAQISFSPDSRLTTLGAYAFRNTAVSSVSLPATLTTIADYAFYDCDNLNNITIPDGVTYIGVNAFADCAALSQLTISRNSRLETIAGYAFEDSALTSIYLPETIRTIGLFAFDGNPLTGVTYGGSRTQWNSISISTGNTILKNADRTYEKVSLIYDLNGGSSEEETAVTVESGSTVELSLIPTREDYQFLGWQRDDELLESNQSVELTENDVTVIAQWKYLYAALKMEVGSGAVVPGYEVVDGVAQKSVHTQHDNEIELPTPTREGYFFCGWALKGENVTSVTVTEDVTVTARWAAPLNDTVYWERFGDTLTIIGTGDMPDYTSSGAKPPYYGATNDYAKVIIAEGITSVGDYAFMNAESLGSVSLPSTLTKIGKNAYFYCIKLNNVTIPDGVTIIDEKAFESCSSLTEITISPTSKLQTLGDYALSGNSISTIYLPETLKTIGIWNFGNTETLQSVIYGGSRAQWSRITIGGGISNAALKEEIITFGKVSLTCDLNGGSCEGQTVFHVTPGTTVELTLEPAREDYEFTGWKKGEEALTGTSIQVSEDTTLTAQWERLPVKLTMNVGNGAEIPGFTVENGTAAEEYEIGTVLSLPTPTRTGYVFRGWTLNGESVTSVTMTAAITVTAKWATCLSDTVAWEKSGDTLIISGTGDMPDYTYNGAVPAYGKTGYTKVVIEEGITSIGEYAFRGAGMESVSLPSTLTEIDQYAFAFCNSLNNVTIPDNVTSIGNGAFNGCPVLTSFTIGENSKLETLDKYAISDSPVASIYLPETLKTIGVWNFSDAETLKSVTYGGSRAQWNSISIANLENTNNALQDSIITYRKVSLTYDLNGGSCNMPTVINVTPGYLIVLDIIPSRGSDYLFDCWMLNGEEVLYVQPTEDITVTAQWVYMYPTLKLEVGDGAEVPDCEVVNGVAESRHLLDSEVELPTPTRPGYDFRGWMLNGESVTSVIMTADITVTAKWAACLSDTVFWEIEDDTLTIFGRGDMPDYTYGGAVPPYGRNGYTKIIIGEGITSVGEYAFLSSSVESVSLPSTLTEIGEYAFAFCYSLKNVTIPDNVTVLGMYAFGLCTDLTQVTISPDSKLETLGSYVVHQTKISTIYLPETLKSIGIYNFTDADTLQSVTYAGSRAQWSKVDIDYSYNAALQDFVMTYQKLDLIYDLNGGSCEGQTVLTAEPGTQIDLTLIPQCADREFIGWTLNGKAVTQVTLQEDITVTAAWKYLKATLTLHNVGQPVTVPDGYEVVNNCITIRCDTGKEILLPRVTKTNYYYIGWQINGEGDALTSVTPAEDMDLYPCWGQAISTTLYFAGYSLSEDWLSQYDHYLSSNFCTVYCAPGTEITLPVLGETSDGRQFLGWKIEDQGEPVTTYTFPETGYGNSLFACWEEPNILFLAAESLDEDWLNGYTYTECDEGYEISVKLGEEITLPVLEADEYGYEFLGWTDRSSEVLFTTFRIEGEYKALYPVWVPHSTVLLTLGEYEGAIEWGDYYWYYDYKQDAYCIIVDLDTELTLPRLDEDAYGFNFLGWTEAGSEEVITTLTTTEESYYLYPVWEEHVTLTLYTEEAVLDNAWLDQHHYQSVPDYCYYIYVTPDTEITLPVMSADEYGFEFLGWKIIEGEDSLSEETYSSFTVTRYDDNVWLTPVWAGDSGYSYVIFRLTGNDIAESWLDQYHHTAKDTEWDLVAIKIENDSTITLPQIVAPEGCTVLGWLDDNHWDQINGLDAYNRAPTTYTENNYYCWFKAISYRTDAALKLPNALTCIESGAFAGIDAEIVFVPAGCTSIESGAFAGCSNLKYVVFETGNPSFDESAFPENVLLILPTTTIAPGSD